MRFWLLARPSLCYAGLFGLIFLIQSCDTAPGASDLISDPPTLSEFTFTPLEFAHTGSGDMAQIPLTLSVRVGNPGGGAVTVQYFVRRQFATETIAEGNLSSSGSGLYTASETISVPRGATGLYVITVTSIGANGAVGNEVTGLLSFESENLGPPEITSVEGPSEFQPPGLLTLVAVVTDPDGLDNINTVEVTVPAGGTFDMFDDGVSFGDEVAGDGRYTAAFDVPEATPGDQVFTFKATDNFGSESEVVPFTVTILP